MGYAVTTSMSASVRASATASLPEMSISCSSRTTPATVERVTTAMEALLCPSGLGPRSLGHAGHDRRRPVRMDRRVPPLALDVLARDAVGHGGAAEPQFAHRELLLVLAPVAEAVGALRRDPVADLLGEPDLVGILVLAPHLPLALVVVEGGLVHHRDAVLHGAHGLAHPASAARLHVRVVQALRRHVEAAVRALNPAERALDAGVEVHHRPHG